MTENKTNMLSRKFLVALTAIFSASILMWFKLIDGGVYSTVIVATVGSYMAANVVHNQNNKENNTRP